MGHHVGKGTAEHALADGGSAELVDALRAAGGTNERERRVQELQPSLPQRACLQASCARFSSSGSVLPPKAPEEWAGRPRVPLEHAAAHENLRLVDALLGAGAAGLCSSPLLSVGTRTLCLPWWELELDLI